MLPLLLLLCADASLPGPPAENTWTQWRGSHRTGIAPGPAWPGRLDSLKQSWKVDLDKGYAGVVVAEDRVFVTESAGPKGDLEVVRALHRATGREIWRASWNGKVSVPFYAKRSGDWIKATPVYDGRTLFVPGMEEVLVALDATTGAERWRIDFPERFKSPKPEFGFNSSPLLDGNALYVQAANSTIKLNRNTGEIIWRSLEHPSDVMQGGAFSSPAIAEIAGKRQLLIQDRIKLNGLDPDSGELLWSIEVPNFRGMNILTPTVFGNSVFTSAYQNNTYLYEVAAQDGKFTVREQWKNKAKGYMSSPVIVDGYAYLHLGNQRFTCIELRTGESRWTTEPHGQYWSMVLRGDKILALDENGKLMLIRPNPERFELLDSREVSTSPAWGHVAVAGDEIFVRELKAVTAWRWTAEPPAVTSAGQ